VTEAGMVPVGGFKRENRAAFDDVEPGAFG
jgi:hypothetical protein